jgi:LuxR family maltose regulon positive regulatory protein
LLVRQGKLFQAKEIYERALQSATDAQGYRLPIASEALIGLGELLREWNDLDAAVRVLEEAIDLCGQWSEMASFDAYLPLARIWEAQGDLEAARRAIETAQELARRSEATLVDDLVADLQRAGFLVAQGDLEGAMGWAERRGLFPGPSQQAPPEGDEELVTERLRKYEYLLLARLYLRLERSAEAIELLHSLLARARELGRVDLIIRVQAQRALAYGAQGEDVEAMESLANALTLAEPGGHVRAFLDVGPGMAGLLRQAVKRGISPSYAAGLLAEFEASVPAAEVDVPQRPSSQPLIDPLSAREFEVLRLLAAGMTNPEIARELVIAVSTVRSHCKSIYGKLDVHRRWDAVERGRKLGLL